MRIALDCRTVTAPKTGDRSYALGLSRALVDVVQDDDDLLLYTWEPSDLVQFARSNVRAVVLPASPRWTWTPFAFPRDLRRRRVEIAHVQYIVPPIAPCPVVTTIHDVSFRRHPEFFPLKHRLLLNWLIPQAVESSAAILTGSEATRKDLVELYDLPPERVTVTPYAVDDSFQPQDRRAAERAVRDRFGLTGPYVLSICHMHPRKNLPRLVRAWARIALSVPHQLVLVGKQGWGNEELNAAISAAGPDREPVFTGYVADADLPVLYAAADLFVYPSLYEGFGLPPLEAMACGTPVLTSNVSSLPEVVGNAALLVDPTDERAIADGLAALLLDPNRCARLSEAGLRRARLFSWKRCARETLAAYRQVLGQ